METIRVRLARLGQGIVEVALPDEKVTVAQALQLANTTPEANWEIRVGGQPATMDTPLADQDVITLVPQIRGG